jgi:tocopherol cyclase
LLHTRWWYKLRHPEIFQGRPDLNTYFEGWYFKLVSEDQQHALALIPGLALYDASDRHAFIQWIDGTGQVSGYHRFPPESFSADDRTLEVRIGSNYFSKERVRLQLPEIEGEIRFESTTPIKQSLFQPGIMGWYSFVPGMQCYHGVVSLHHTLRGETHGALGKIKWDDGKGYIEKDWGTSFPKCWIWIHSNNFSNSTASLMASVAHIPWMGRYFPGYIVVLWIDGAEYRFATYNGSRMKCKVNEDGVELQFKRNNLELFIHARSGPTAQLRSPITGQMTGKVNESLQATVNISLLGSGSKIWSSTGTSAGLEVAGDTTILETDIWRR